MSWYKFALNLYDQNKNSSLKTTSKSWLTFVKRSFFASVCTDRILLSILQTYVQELFFSDQSIIFIQPNNSCELELENLFFAAIAGKKSWAESRNSKIYLWKSPKYLKSRLKKYHGWTSLKKQGTSKADSRLAVP